MSLSLIIIIILIAGFLFITLLSENDYSEYGKKKSGNSEREKNQYDYITDIVDEIEVNDSSCYKFLEQYNIKYLYHITHIENLPNIIDHGLLSHYQSYDENLNITDISISAVNERRNRNDPLYNRNLHEYVPLYFNPKNPMLFVRRSIQENIVILCIDPIIVHETEYLFTDGNAASTSTNFYNEIRDLQKLNWACINGRYWNDFIDGRRIRCAEILIYPMIVMDYLKRIICYDNKYENIINTMIINNRNIELVVDQEYYF